MLESYFVTDVGLIRTNNEDSGAIIGKGVFVVADGMGGAAAGEKASGIVVEVARRMLTTGNGSLSAAITTANAEIIAAAKENPALKGMGTTATLCRVNDDGQGEFAHVGDSRLYLLQAGNLRQLTEDHSYVEELVRDGKLKREDARFHPMKNLLTRAVGAEQTVKINSGTFSMTDGDKLLLATDGLTNMVSDFDIRDIMQYEEGNTAQKLVAAALAAGGRDNVTVLAVIYHAN